MTDKETKKQAKIIHTLDDLPEDVRGAVEEALTPLLDKARRHHEHQVVSLGKRVIRHSKRGMQICTIEVALFGLLIGGTLTFVGTSLPLPLQIILGCAIGTWLYLAFRSIRDFTQYKSNLEEVRADFKTLKENGVDVDSIPEKGKKNVN